MVTDNENTLILSGSSRAQASVAPDQSTSRVIRFCVTITLLSFVTFVVVDSLTSQHIKTAIIWFLQWVETNPWQGVLTLIVVYTFATGKVQGQTLPCVP
jgi:hypothetical protein